MFVSDHDSSLDSDIPVRETETSLLNRFFDDIDSDSESLDSSEVRHLNEDIDILRKTLEENMNKFNEALHNRAEEKKENVKEVEIQN